ncbi:MAG: PQQ-dependent sugar dehydrogenase [Solirubrobacterales bacterium]|nr:PQQ-dependent sugar dehydrogenase [Solirubrobacterales bacterium]
MPTPSLLAAPAMLITVVVALVALGGGACGTDPGSSQPIRPAAPAPAPAVEVGGASSFALERVADGLERPTWVGSAPGDPGALWALEQPGRVVRLQGGRRTVVLDLHEEVLLGAEQGLLAAAFHPGFATNGRLVLHFSDRNGDTRVVEFRVGDDGRANPARRRELLFERQPEENHNGGAIVFGPDGDLYLGLGDGGGAFDPRGVAQDLGSRLGKLLAADVDGRGRPRWRAVAYGLRNPWRFSFDPALGEVWIGDVGQDEREEVHRAYLEPDEPPKNFGWSAFDGTQAVDGHRLDRTGELVWPVVAYGRDDGCSIIGGVVYRGARLQRLRGRYLYGDFCTGALWTLRPLPGGRAGDVRRERATLPQVTHIGTGEGGEPLLASSEGTLWRAVAPRG